MQQRAHQRGYLMVAAVILIVIVASLAVFLSTMLASNVSTTVNNMGSMQALYEAESGLEYGQRQLAVDLDWYRNSADPVNLPAQTLGAGGFTVSISVPVTELRTRTTLGTGSINVYTTGRYPTAGRLQIEDDTAGTGEIVEYSSTTANTFNVTVRGVSGTIASHARGSRVYPVTTLSTALPANCTTVASINLAAHPKFLGAGTIDIQGEELLYSGSSTSGGTLTLTGVLRCQNGTLAAAHAAGAFVTPMLVDSAPVDYEAEVISTGTLGNDQRISRRSVQR